MVILKRFFARAALILSVMIGPAPPTPTYANDVENYVKLVNEVSGHILARRFKEAEASGKKLVAFSDTAFSDEPGIQVMSLGMLITVYDLQGKYGEAEPLMQKVLASAERLKGVDHLPALQSLETVALTFKGQGRYVEAERLYKRGLAIREEVRGRDHPDLCNTLIFLGIGSFSQGRLFESETYFKRALAIGEKQKQVDHPGVILSLLPLAAIYKTQGRFTEAEALTRRAMERSEKHNGVTHQLISSLKMLSSLCEDTKQYDDAEKYQRRALELTGKQKILEKPAFEAAGLEDLARLYRLQGRHADAEKMARQAVEHLEKAYGSQESYLGSPLIELARAQEAAGRLTNARETLDRALNLPHRKPSPKLLAQRAQIAWKEGKRADALAYLSKSLDLAESQRARISGGEREQAYRFAQVVDLFVQMVAWQTELGNLAAAMDTAERARSKSLLDQLELRGVDLLAGVPAEQATRLRRQELDARIRVASFEKQLQLLAGDRTLPADESKRRQAKLTEKLTEAQRDALSAYREIRLASPLYLASVTRNRKPAALESVRSWVAGHDGLLLQYVLGQQGGFVIVVPGDGSKARIERLQLTREQARVLGMEAGSFGIQQANEEVAALMPLLSRPGRSNEALPHLEVLYHVLVPAPERARLDAGKVKRLFIVPDGPLSMVPFETLVIDAKEPRYLLDVGAPVLYAPSATVLLNLAERTARALASKRTSVLTVGDPAYPSKVDETPSPDTFRAARRYQSGGGRLQRLPGSAQESKTVAENFEKAGASILQLLDKEATEARVRGSISGPQIVHLACHGLTDETWGNYFGALALTPGSKKAVDPADDGFLTLAEIHGLDLGKCQLAVLSACNTNFGPHQRGEGTWALSRGFLAAGARRVIASNWIVDDAATRILVSRLSEGLSRPLQNDETFDPAGALHAAKLHLRKNPKWCEPYYWASMVHIGPP